MKSANVCPMCRGARKPARENSTFPFCSARCKLADLGNWLDGRYSLAGEPAGLDDDDGDLRSKPN